MNGQTNDSNDTGGTFTCRIPAVDLAKNRSDTRLDIPNPAFIWQAICEVKDNHCVVTYAEQQSDGPKTHTLLNVPLSKFTSVAIRNVTFMELTKNRLVASLCIGGALSVLFLGGGLVKMLMGDLSPGAFKLGLLTAPPIIVGTSFLIALLISAVKFFSHRDPREIEMFDPEGRVWAFLVNADEYDRVAALLRHNELASRPHSRATGVTAR